ncbi:flavin reductase family protein [Novosphingobium sp. 1949]|uniref:Flavin reductase family protein n=1 Tax=Novosphingobium organovorum TaxID=2930092 RepID=A0ABT0BBI2_9SPHN|nr:flavin reductase family protein [Novosphingobium organovorum]MCJ2182425.1 flavin reductase family protein [Novosphingobium organovorum]
MDKLLFRAAMAQLGAAVTIVTTDGPAGRFGSTASAVCSVSDDPGSVLVCINRNSRLNTAIIENKVLAINVLGGDQEDLSGTFATPGLGSQERFAKGEWRAFDNGTPLLSDALVSLSCSLHHIQEVGSHGVFIGHVEEVHMREQGEGLIYFGRQYHRIGPVAG